jgi:hypothetical protein
MHHFALPNSFATATSKIKPSTIPVSVPTTKMALLKVPSKLFAHGLAPYDAPFDHSLA